MARRVGWTDLGFDARAFLLQAAVAPKALYASSVAALPARPCGRLRSAMLSALWGAGRRLRCKEVVLTLLSKGHKLDPVQVDAYEALLALRRMIAHRTDLRGVFVSTWHAAAGSRHVRGPVGKAIKLARALGWAWPAPWAITTQEGVTMDIRSVGAK